MEIERRNKWIGILIGACIIAGGAYSTLFGMIVFYTMVLLFVFGGFISGVYLSRKMRDGIWFGLLSGIAGGLIVLISILGLLIYDTIRGVPGFAEGMELVIGVYLFLAAIVLATVGGGIGGVARWALLKVSKEGQGKSLR
ncbi:hypothetical protein J2741_001242 [Methanolinea mesophila]|uniref:hypothetical protein n=1 Tax=Methanolinea mesophila TaxID=547055 RepID=UPI001AE19227|nr:hypothetical protein [Methanolinea mesophila]MBP1928695.1 hypothetical protein [Methanolinea mesophila]